ncbi:MAG: DUF3857 domain-containing protein [Acidobacteriia bacterium]|nr:DUF3857 domain-containing protein [Terriglobia bacterium]
MLKKEISAALFLCVIGFWPVHAVAGVPDWLKSTAQQPAKKYADDVDAVTLLDEQETTVNDNGEMVFHERVAYRILRPDGRGVSTLRLQYDDETKVRNLHGWSITAKGQEYEAKEKDSLERSVSSYDVYSDVKEKILAVPGADVGTVVGFEFERRQRPNIFQDRWYFQDMIPVERARFTLRLPASWEFKASWVNHAEQPPATMNGTYVWELTDIPRIEREVQEPPYRALAGHMTVNFFSERNKGQTFKSWNELGQWYGQLTAGVRDPVPALQQKVQELAPASLPMLDRIRALARFAQRDVRYAAIEVGIGGYRPHPAGEVFTHRYGDCKDKANVLSTMLAQIGVKSFYMPIHNQPGIFTEKSPPDMGFNHVILAIQLPEGSFDKPLPAVYEHPKLGHLLIFDPTEELVPFGQLPYYEQDSYSLLVTDNGGELIHLPASRPELNGVKRIAKMKLLADGTLQGDVEEVRSGYHAMMARAYLKDQTQQNRKKILEHLLGRVISNFQVDSFSIDNADDIDKDLVLRYKFTAEHYAKNAGPLLLVRPRVVGEKGGYMDSTKPRHYAYELEAPFLDSDNIEISLPEGFKVDELPDPAKASFEFGEYTSKIEAADAVLRYSRQYKMRGSIVPLDRMDQLKKLFAAISTDEQKVAVLTRK